MALIVQKFGGSSVADADRIRNVARIITETYRRGHRVVAVLSAQGDTTDAGAIAATGCGVKTAMLAFPIRGLHTLQERARLKDLEQCAALLAAAYGG